MMKKSDSTKLWRFILLTSLCCFTFVWPIKTSAQEKPILFPVPQQLQVINDAFVLDESVSIIISQNASEKDNSLARLLVRELSDRYGIALRIETQSVIPKGRKVVVMGSIQNPLIKKYCLDNKVELTQKTPGSEGYILQVNNNSVIIGGSDDSGAFYGLQSLRQLMQTGKGKKIQGVKVRDWPNFPFRAIRLYIPGPENMAFFNRFLGDFMALYKYNKVVLELNCMRLDKHPEVNTGWIEFAKYMQYSRSNSTEGVHGEEKLKSL